MGVIHKLRPEVRQSILDEKRANPMISCRSLSYLILQRFKIEVSKSSINSIFKEAGLSMPVGRTLKRKKRVKSEVLLLESKPEKLPEKQPSELLLETKPEKPVEKPVEKPPEKLPEKQPAELLKAEVQTHLPSEMPCTGAILLKAADCLIGGSRHITELIKSSLNIAGDDLLAKTEGLIYLPLFEKPQQGQINELQALIGRGISFESIMYYHNELQAVKTLEKDISQVIEEASKEVRCIKINFSTNDSSYIDGQMYTVWSTPYTPYDFSTTICNTGSYINNHFNNKLPLVLFTAPGYNVPTKEFFNLILGLESESKSITGLKIHGNKLEDLNSISFEVVKKRFFVFAMWPWQFVNYRKVLKIGEFKPFYFEPLGLNLYLSEIEVELSQPDMKQPVTLKGCALKTLLSEKTRVVILSNLTLEAGRPENLANIYLNRWPNLGETFQDFSRKIELFTYRGSSQRFFSAECMERLQASSHPKTTFENYLQILDLYVRWHFLPEGFKEKDFPTAKEQFYGLNAILKRGDGRTVVKFNPPQGYLFLKELEYACHRINEKEILFADNSRLWCLP
ncbi:MAG: hypothetical protein PHI59_09370 [Candidatus Omnitrophica bacterium]|nr:hypothetical protein [Candidatus Omnitrophota bacterium]